VGSGSWPVQPCGALIFSKRLPLRGSRQLSDEPARSRRR
jgi:hypothetical protein